MTPDAIRARLAAGESLSDLEREADEADQRPSFLDRMIDRVGELLWGPDDEEDEDELDDEDFGP